MNNSQEHEYVDLGLPSGTLWATCNVGANKPEDYGLYFSWDEGISRVASWGEGWIVPTKEMWEELVKNTKNTWETINGVNGRLFTASNGNRLFLPAIGSRRWDDELDGAGCYGSYGYFWSRSLYTDYPSRAWYLNFNSGSCYMDRYGRLNGFSVRPVRQN